MKVLIVDDEKPARDRLRSLLEEMPVYQCCGTAGNGVEALRMANAEQPDIVLLDIPGHEYLPYHYGVNHVRKVIRHGRVVFERQA